MNDPLAPTAQIPVLGHFGEVPPATSALVVGGLMNVRRSVRIHGRNDKNLGKIKIARVARIVIFNLQA